MKRLISLLFLLTLCLTITACGGSKTGSGAVDTAETELAKAEAEKAQAEAEKAKAEAELAKAEAEKAKAELEAAEKAANKEEDKTEEKEEVKVDGKEEVLEEESKEEVKEEVKEEEEETVDPMLGNGTLSDDLYSFEIEMNGKHYKFPMTYKEFASYGWEIQVDPTTKLDPDQYTYELFDMGDTSMYAFIINFGVNVASLEDSLIAGVIIEEYYVEDTGFKAMLPGGIMYENASLEEVEAQYGKSTDIYEGELYTKLTYTLASYQTVILEIDAETDKLSYIKIQNFERPKDMDVSNMEFEVPAIVSQYSEPKNLDDDITKFIVNYDGDMYKMPAPVSAFIDNGWRLVTDEDTVVKAKSWGVVELSRNNQTLRAYINNYHDGATLISNCFATGIKADRYDTDVAMSLSDTIYRGMDGDEFVAAIEDYNVEVEESDDYTYYKIKPSKRSLDYYECIVYGDKNILDKIVLSYTPDDEDLFE